MSKFKDLEKLRIKHNYRYGDMAKLLHVSKTYYWQIENKKRRLSYQTAKEIASIFNLKPDNIFYND